MPLASLVGEPYARVRYPGLRYVAGVKGTADGSFEGVLEEMVDGTANGAFDGTVNGVLDGRVDGTFKGSSVRWNG